MPPNLMAPSDVAVIVPVGGRRPPGVAAPEPARLDPAPGEIVAVIDGPNDELADEPLRSAPRWWCWRSGEARRGPAIVESRRPVGTFCSSSIPMSRPRWASCPGRRALHCRTRFQRRVRFIRRRPGDPGFLSQYRNLFVHFVHQKGCETASTFWAGCGAVRRRAFCESRGLRRTL